MNKLSLGINAVLVIAVGVLYYFHFSGKKETTVTDADLLASRDSISRNLTMVYVNIDSLLTNYKYVEEVEKQLEAKKNTMLSQISSKSSQLESKLGAKAEALQRKAQDFEAKAEGMSPSLQQIRMQTLQEEDQALQQESMEAQQTIMELKETLGAQLMQEEADLNDEVQKQITDYLEKYNKDHNYTFIVAKGTGAGVLFAHDALDITNDILEGLNKEYEEKKKAEKK
jgi:outer membrane protein